MTLFPLSAIVGQEALVEALLINAVAPDVGGVLVRGQRGTAKSTAVRALAPLLPAVEAAADEAFAFAPGAPFSISVKCCAHKDASDEPTRFSLCQRMR